MIACALTAAAGIFVGIVGDGGRAQSRPAPVAGEPKKSDAPAATIVLVGPKLGMMEPCGCTGGQLGGLPKLKTRLELMAQAAPNAVIIDCGELVKRKSDMERLRGETMAAVYMGMPVSVVALGPGDLASDADDLTQRAQLMALDVTIAARFPNATLTNVATNAAAMSSIAPYAIVPSKVGDGPESRVLVLSLVDADGFQKPAEAARSALAKAAGKFDLCAAVYHGYQDRARELVAEVPAIDLLVLGSGSGSPDPQPQLYGNTLLIHPGQKGRHVVQLSVARRGGKVVFEGFAIETITAAVPSDKEAQSTVDNYRDRLMEGKIVEKLVRQRPLDTKGLGGKGYAGSAKCGECHVEEYKIWEGSKHAHALASLTERKGQWDPDCLKCHVVGWFSEPPSGEKTGYTGNPEKFGYVGCESCHGPAALHTTQPKLNKPPSRDVTCQQCHDVENSPEFDRAKFWEKIKHKNSAK
jgi:hypothetical protein